MPAPVTRESITCAYLKVSHLSQLVSRRFTPLGFSVMTKILPSLCCPLSSHSHSPSFQSSRAWKKTTFSFCTAVIVIAMAVTRFFSFFFGHLCLFFGSDSGGTFMEIATSFKSQRELCEDYGLTLARVGFCSVNTLSRSPPSLSACFFISASPAVCLALCPFASCIYTSWFHPFIGSPHGCHCAVNHACRFGL